MQLVRLLVIRLWRERPCVWLTSLRGFNEKVAARGQRDRLISPSTDRLGGRNREAGWWDFDELRGP